MIAAVLEKDLVYVKGFVLLICLVEKEETRGARRVKNIVDDDGGVGRRR